MKIEITEKPRVRRTITAVVISFLFLFLLFAMTSGYFTEKNHFTRTSPASCDDICTSHNSIKIAEGFSSRLYENPVCYCITKEGEINTYVESSFGGG
jgi:hypothetical protein